jgi:hypothetical protein
MGLYESVLRETYRDLEDFSNQTFLIFTSISIEILDPYIFWEHFVPQNGQKKVWEIHISRIFVW